MLNKEFRKRESEVRRIQKRRMKPTHLEEKETMTAQHNESILMRLVSQCNSPERELT